MCTVIWLILLATVIDRSFIAGRGLDDVRGLLVTMAVLLLVRGACGWLGERWADAASGRLRSRVRSELVAHVFAVGPAGLSGERTGEVSATIGAGVEALHGYVTRFITTAAIGVLGPTIVFGVVLVADPWSSLILAFTGPMLVLLLAVIGGRTRALTKRRFDELGWLSAFYLDMIRGLGTLKAFRRSADGADTIADVSRRYGDATMDVLRTAFQTSLVMEWAATAATALVAVEVSFRLVHGDLSFGTALAVLVLVPEFFVPFRRLALEYHSGHAGRAALERIDDLLALPALAPATSRPGGGSVAGSGTGSGGGGGRPPTIELVDVGFTYPGSGAPSLDGLDLSIAAGETVALVGPSGAGKTTVSRLLMRFAEPSSGRILIDGGPLGDVDPAAWRQRIAWVPQDPTLIAGTVAQNIRLGDPGAADDRVRAAAEAARAVGFIEALPDGFATVLGERGLRLSGGQRQRLAIARAALRDAPVVVLDEFTAHLDHQTEAELIDAIAELLAGRTALVIAHRPRTLRLADRVVTLERGRVAP
ncbi:MAG: Cysteine export CydDC family transporter permease subunit/ATP-binding protein CydD [Ilumatobacteraceae bacterium]|nr:Cysteine export CydDC family transporter permease subunit/ATP-binding protein CydD [Ilumatobacteraceae bacterium]